MAGRRLRGSQGLLAGLRPAGPPDAEAAPGRGRAIPAVPDGGSLVLLAGRPRTTAETARMTGPGPVRSTLHWQRLGFWTVPCRQACNLRSKKAVSDRLRASVMAFSKYFPASAARPARK